MHVYLIILSNLNTCSKILKWRWKVLPFIVEYILENIFLVNVNNPYQNTVKYIHIEVYI